LRKAGILMPITSLPSPYGIGTMGEAAREFVRFLHKAGQSYWQILPICPTSYGDSPYQSFSSYAGNPYMIDLDELSEAGLLEKDEYKNIDWDSNPEKADYGLLYNRRFGVLRKAAKTAEEKYQTELTEFRKENHKWLSDYALFMAIKDEQNGVSWLEWPEILRKRDNKALAVEREKLKDEIKFWECVQFLFFTQWKKLKAYANENGIKIIGDIPIYVSSDSADVWANPEQFQLDDNLMPISVAGCPPDGFSADGQLWGNPLFNWKVMKEQDYNWWVDRIAYQTQIYDMLRIDHFRGFDAYYSIPYGDNTARNGEWKEGPGIDLFNVIKEKLGELPIIAEDLGFLTDSVRKLLKDTGFPGMKVLEFAFDSRDTESGYLPHLYPKNCVVYAGTHDNETILGWFDTISEEDAEYAKKYMRLSEAEGYHWGMMRTAWASVADTAIMQMQDILGLGKNARMNTPSTLSDKNWSWRCLPGVYNDTLADVLHQEMKLYGRI
jgi:4-alpha-glucanotransferase